MRTVSAAGHVVELVKGLAESARVTPLTADQLEVVRAAVERVYGIPLDLPTPDEMAAWTRARGASPA